MLRPMRMTGIAGVLASLLTLAACNGEAADRKPKADTAKTYTMPSNSMEPTLTSGEKIEVRLVDDYVPIRGDIVVFRVPDGWFGSPGKQFGRVIAIGGDHLTCCDSGGRQTLNDKPLDEPYLGSGVAGEMPFDVIVPTDSLWLEGDNRGFAPDSRAHQQDPGGGFVPWSRVIGVAQLQ